MAKHRISLTDEEINILLESLDSADWYSDDHEFYKMLEKIRKKLKDALDIDKYLKRRVAGLISASRRKDLERFVKMRKSLFEEVDRDESR